MNTGEQGDVRVEVKLNLSDNILDNESTEIVGGLLICLQEHGAIPPVLKMDIDGYSYISDDITLHANRTVFSVAGLVRDVNAEKVISWFKLMYEKYKRDLQYQVWITGINNFVFSAFLYTEDINREDGSIERNLRGSSLGPDILLAMGKKAVRLHAYK